MQIQSKACCSRPPVTLSGGYDYVVKGEYVDFNGMKTYVTGKPDVKRGIFLFYDVFGLYIQALKGADILAMDYEQYPDGAGDFKVFMPDWWGDNPQDLKLFPPKTPEEIKKINAFFVTGPANPEKAKPLVQPLFQAIRAKHPEITEWAVMGFCWGGKMTAMSSQPDTIFKAAAQCHPSLVDPNDISEIKIPMVVLPSMDEDAKVSSSLS
ncbi:hypothetical protein H2198_008796 [Neophaeococcomyces mojaviensis]|uniref:Uncharacterized protein n=1 Tax=Neophaeococcomyces mojaviensis TaxID=3383035 RepID=A0ACC2ZWB0_9EURO|nr:hypothetical protein H2198_008796 [Knufia sp. JES_112]